MSLQDNSFRLGDVSVNRLMSNLNGFLRIMGKRPKKERISSVLDCKNVATRKMYSMTGVRGRIGNGKTL